MTAQLTLPESLTALQHVIDDCRGRVDDALLDPAQALVNRAGKRLSLAGETTVVALAGATGAGKSTLFNALSRSALAETGVRRPTTSQSMSVTFGTGANAELLTWLGIPRRHSVPGKELTDLVLVDLPDYDSTVQRHRDEVDRMIELADVILWVVDPQKYADSALHDRYLIPMATHAPAMIFVLNQIDRVRPEQIDRIRGDLAKLLAEEGITGVDIHAISAATGQGVDQLRRALRDLAARKQAVAARLLADVTDTARSLQAAVGPTAVRELGEHAMASLDRALAEAAGVSEVAEAVEASWVYRGRVATGWPITAWLRRLKPDPLRRLHLSSGATSDSNPAPTDISRTSIRAWQSVPAARVDSALRSVTDDSVAQLPRGWQQAVNRAARSYEQSLPDQLDRAIGSTDLKVDAKPVWWRITWWFQVILFAVVLLALVWLAVNFIGHAYLGLPEIPSPYIGQLPLPTVLALGGLLVGFLTAAICRALVTAQAKAKGSWAARLLNRKVAQITTQVVIDPVNDELKRHNRARAYLNQLLIPGR